MKKGIIILISILTIGYTRAQDYSTYHPSATMVNDLVHTKLKVGFDIPNEKLFGEAWITLKPHFYPTDSLTLDAKGMEISSLTLNGTKALKYTYTNDQLKIKLDKSYTKNENYTVYIKYVAIPGSIKQKGSEAIQDARGLYFINPRGENKDKPTQIWTQGETESNSCWFPTIDKPNQKTSEEIYITVPDKYVTLSNGTLKNQTKNNDGTRTDYWKFDKKHAPYLFFMGIGEFSIVKDKWKNIPVDYYVDKEYEPYAKQIFGDTPSMLEYFSTLLQYPYPWEKYSQMVARDYISGAMENTTCTLHEESALQKPGQLVDKNIWEPVIAHELFHHWFGDLATTESWSNLPVNESFANYSEYLWLEHKYGKDYAEEHRDNERDGYMYGGENFDKDLIRFKYKDREDMMDAVSYNKGGLILHMLRNYLGDDAFFAGMSLYLKTNEYKATEAHQLRLAWEEVSGKDLNWFFNQWFFGNGHPKLKAAYAYNEAKKTVTVTLTQSQEPKFQFPLDIDVYENGKPTRHHVWAKAAETNSFELPYKSKPQLININPDKILLCELNDDKTTEQYIVQYKYAPEYSSRKEAVSKLADAQTSNAEALETLLKAASSDKFEGLRTFAISKLDETNPTVKQKSASVLEKIATSDAKTLVQAKAIKQLASIDASKYKDLFIKSFNSPSYGVKAASILGVLKVDKNAASELVSKIDDKNPGSDLSLAIAKTAIVTKDNSKLSVISKNFLNLLLSAESQDEADTYFEGLQTIMMGDYPNETQTVVDSILKIYPQAKKYSFGEVMLQIMQGSLQMKQQASNASPLNKSLKDQVNYITNGLNKMK
ncbi:MULTISPECIES: M1 family metallopeptidase [unclassified Apibacter]|uniref:M1 family metallopeptidase n=1 Tax=unclassified Apibacter TaxID=2630820 RepID=UPI00132647CC|nr:MULTISPECIES: M1 family aminopeptidase [unclassified Apibacter]MCX8677969.1 M1 family peptidase [Apibacter sp. B3919]MXO24375.1 M1 family peptidase [Apibacter sp. B3924]MXO25619.1 M1 family peptidase [Apibacter sp. B3813]MXO27569.1 M1 family peptidase [Apibacter sp. B3913]MXO30071.1 M1 family peptidase [Apibacter sp. B3912]